MVVDERGSGQRGALWPSPLSWAHAARGSLGRVPHLLSLTKVHAASCPLLQSPASSCPAIMRCPSLLIVVVVGAAASECSSNEHLGVGTYISVVVVLEGARGFSGSVRGVPLVVVIGDACGSGLSLLRKGEEEAEAEAGFRGGARHGEWERVSGEDSRRTASPRLMTENAKPSVR